MPLSAREADLCKPPSTVAKPCRAHRAPVPKAPSPRELAAQQTEGVVASVLPSPRGEGGRRPDEVQRHRRVRPPQAPLFNPPQQPPRKMQAFFGGPGIRGRIFRGPRRELSALLTEGLSSPVCHSEERKLRRILKLLHCSAYRSFAYFELTISLFLSF